MLCFSLSPELGTVRCCTSATWMHFAHCTRTKQGNSLSGITFGKPLKTIEGYGLTISYFRQLWQFDSRPARSTKNRGRRKSRLTTRPSFSRWLLNIGLDMSELAERVGFEPTLEFPLNTLSKRAPSATRPSLRLFKDIRWMHSRSEYTLWRMPRMGFNDFIRERRYLNNVSPATISWYTHAFKWLPSESPTQDELKDVVLRMREKALKETGCNAAIRAINAYLHWSSGSDRKCGAGCRHPRIRQLKEP